MTVTIEMILGNIIHDLKMTSTEGPSISLHEMYKFEGKLAVMCAMANDAYLCASLGKPCTLSRCYNATYRVKLGLIFI